MNLELLDLRKKVSDLQKNNANATYMSLQEKSKKYVEAVQYICNLIDKETKILREAAEKSVMIDSLDNLNKCSTLTKYLNGKCPPEILSPELDSNLKNIQNFELELGLGIDRFT